MGRWVIKLIQRSQCALTLIILAGAIADSTAVAGNRKSHAVVPAGQAASVSVRIGHSEEVSAVAFSPDGKTVATCGGEDALKLWNSTTGELLRTLRDEEVEEPVCLRAMSFSGDGQKILTGGDFLTLRVWSVTTGRVLDWRGGDILDPPVFTEGLTYFAEWESDESDSDDDKKDPDARIFQSVTWKKLHTLKGFRQNIRALAFAPNINRFAIVDGDGRGLIWDPVRRRFSTRIDDFEGKIHSISYSPDGKWILGRDDKALRLWDALTGRPVRTFEPFKSSAKEAKPQYSVVRYSPDGTRVIAVGTREGTPGVAHVWDPRTGAPLFSLEGHERFEGSDQIGTAAFSKDGKRIVTGAADLTARIWDARTGRLLKTLGGRSAPVSGVLIAPNNKRVLVGNGAVAQEWDLTTGRLVRTFKAGGFDYSPSGDRIATASSKGAQIRDAATGKLLATLRQPVPAGIMFLPDGETVLTVDNDKVQPWNARTGKLLPAWPHDKAMIDFSRRSRLGIAAVELPPPKDAPPDSNVALFGVSQVKIFNIETGRDIRILKSTDNGDSPFAVAISDDGKLAALGTDDDGGEIWDVKTGRQLAKLVTGNEDSHVDSIRFSPNGLHVTTGHSNGVVRIWRTKTGKLVRKLEGHALAVLDATFSRDGRRIATASADKTTRIWDAETGAHLVTFFGSDETQWLAITPEGYFAASSNGAKLLSVVRDNESYSIDQFYQSLYRPDLVQEKLAGDPLGNVKSAAARLDLDGIIAAGRPPAISLLSPAVGRNVKSGSVIVTAKLTARDGGIGRVEWRVNGITLAAETSRGFERLPKAKKKTLTIRRKLQLTPGENEIDVVAYNAKNLIASDPARIIVNWKVAALSRKPNLHVLAVGVDDYFDSRLQLNFAVSDARAVAAALKNAGKGLYAMVKVTALLNDDVTVQGLETAFSTVAKNVRPNDVFVFFIAGHGKTVDGHYYFIPQDFRFKNVRSIREKGIGQDKWQAWFSKIQARKSIMLYDTCESGSLTGQRIATRGVAPGWAMAKLNRATGRTVLSASTDDAPALEGYRGHGVFTYTLLQALAGSDRNDNKMVEILELADFVESRVPEISHQAFGIRQIPQFDIVGSNFPLVRQTATVAPASSGVPEISSKPTHVVIKPAALFETEGGRAETNARLNPGTLVTLVRVAQGWVLVAKDGKTLGFVASDSLARVQ